MTSASPTLSSTSSNPFASSQSRHTPNTSVDLSRALSSVFASSRSSLNSGLYQQSYCTAPETHMQSPAKPQTTGFNMDDYLSSDDDSFIEPRRSRGGRRERPPLQGTTATASRARSSPVSKTRLRRQHPSSGSAVHAPACRSPSGDLRLAYSSNPPTAGRPFTPDRYARSTTARRYIVDPSLGYHENSDRFYATDADDFLSRPPPDGSGPAPRPAAQDEQRCGAAHLGPRVRLQSSRLQRGRRGHRGGAA